MNRSLKALGLLAIGVLSFSMPAAADNEGVSFDGNILWKNNGGGAQYDQTPYGALNETTEDFVTSNFANNRIIDPGLVGTQIYSQALLVPITLNAKLSNVVTDVLQ